MKKEEVSVDGEVVTAYLPVFEKLLTEVSNLNISAAKVDGDTTVTITKKDGSTEEAHILDGGNG